MTTCEKKDVTFSTKEKYIQVKMRSFMLKTDLVKKKFTQK